MLKTFVATLSVFVFTGCANVSPMLGQKGDPNVYSRSQAMQQGYVVTGVILQVRETKIQAGQGATAIGGTLGALTGIALGKGKSGSELAGGIIGAVAGGAIGKAVGSTKGIEMVIRLDNGSMRAIVQEPGGVTGAPGERVYVLINGQESRVISKA